MRQMYSCPKCNGRLVYGETFCISCGSTLKWLVQEKPLVSSPPSCASQGSGQEQTRAQQLPQNLQQIEGGQGPISTEISKMLEELFHKRIDCRTQ